MLPNKVDYLLNKGKEGVYIDGLKINELATSLGLEVIQTARAFLVVNEGSKPNLKGIYEDCMFSTMNIYSVLTFLKGYKNALEK